MQNRVMIFVDGANLLSGWRTYCKNNNHIDENGKITKKLGYDKLLTFLTSGLRETELIRPYFFDGLRDPNDNKKKRFLDKLRSLGFTVDTPLNKQKTKTCPHCKKDFTFDVQKGVDVSLATHVLGLAFEGAYDIAIIVSGDGDYEKAIHFIKNKGINVWTVSFKDSLSPDLRKISDKVIKLDDHFDKLIFSEDSEN